MLQINIIVKLILVLSFSSFFVLIFGSKIDICTTHGCSKAAEYLLNSIDTTKDPCNNFFEFACAKWKKKNPIPNDNLESTTWTLIYKDLAQKMKRLLEDEKSSNSTSNSIRLARKLYMNCMDTEFINKLKSQPLIDAIYSVGGWPLLTPTWNSYNVDFTDLLGRMHRDFGVDVFFKVDMAADTNDIDSNPMLLTIIQSVISVSLLQKHDSKQQLSSTIDIFGPSHKYMLDIIKLLASDMNILITEKIVQQINEIYEFELELAAAVYEGDSSGVTIQLDDLNSFFSFIDWKTYFRLTIPSNIFDIVIDNSSSLVRLQGGYLTKMQTLLAKSDPKVIHNYIIWKLISKLANDLDDRYADIFQQYVKVVFGQISKPLRWTKCVGSVNDVMGIAVGALYVKSFFKEDDRKEALVMFNNVQQSFIKMINNSLWMDIATKSYAIEKVDAMLAQFGYPEFILNDVLVDAYYKDLVFVDESNYFNLKRAIKLWRQNNYLKQILKPFDRFKFVDSPVDVNAYYKTENVLVFPAGILQSPLINSEFPKSVNYGALGFLIGHEIGHAFDSYNVNFDKNGNFKPWLSEYSEELYVERMKCLLEQYNSYVVPETFQKVNGSITLDENVADHGGIKAAYLAYERLSHNNDGRLPGLENMTNEQIFFISFASSWCDNIRPEYASKLSTESHSPLIFRVIGALSNFEAFSKAFDCPKGSNMNPPNLWQPDKCSVW